MTTATNVPTHGFVSPPAGPAPVQAPAQQDFGGVPPAGNPPRMPNGNSYASPNMQPGWVQNPGQSQPQQQAQQQAPVQPQATQDVSSIVAMLQAAMAGQPAPQAQAPVQQQAEAQRPAWVPESANAFDVAKIEDPVIRSMASVLQASGKDLDLDRVIGRALAFGDASLIDTKYLQEAGGANAPQLAEIAKGIVQAVTAKAEAITNSVYESVGGEHVWQASMAAFNQSAPQEVKLVVKQMLDSTNEQFIKAGAKIVADFGKSSGMLPQQGAPLLHSASAGLQAQGLSKAQFQQELIKLRNDRNVSDDAKAQAEEALFARRAMGKRTGL